MDFYPGDGTRRTFVFHEDGKFFEAPAGVFLDLYRPSERQFVLISPDHTLMFFDGQGRLAKISDRNTTEEDGSDGNAMRFLYDGAGRLVEVLDPVNRPVNFSYYSPDTAPGASGGYPGLISQVSDFDGRTVSYSYTSDGQLSDVTGPDPRSAGSGEPHTTLSWTAPSGDTKSKLYHGGELLSASDNVPGHGPLFELQYPATPGIAGSAAVGGGTWDISPGTGGQTTVTDPRGNATTYTHDDAGHAVEITEPGGLQATTSLVYDSEGRLQALGRPLGDGVEYDYEPPAAGGDPHSKRAMGNVVTVTETPRAGSAEALAGQSRVTTIGYEGRSNQVVSYTAPAIAPVTIQRDSRGNPTSVADGTLSTSMHFDERGLIASSDDTQTGHKDYTYETTDPLKIGYLTGVTTSAGSTAYSLDNRGNVTTMRDPAGNSATYTVNSLDQVEQEIRGGGAGQAITSSVFDAAGNVVERSVLTGADASGNPVNSITQFSVDEVGRMQHRIENGRDTAYSYDSAGNLTGVSPPSSPAVAYTYDERNRMATMQVGTKPAASYRYDDDDSRVATTNPRGKTTSFALNGFGENVGETDPMGVTTASRVDSAGRPIDSRTFKTNPDGTRTLYRWSQTQYDPLGRVTREIKKLFTDPIALPADGSDPTGDITDGITQTVYDDANHKTTVIDPRGLATVTETDALGRTLRVTDPAGDKIEYEYFANGNKKSETTTELRPDGGSDVFTTTFDYDDQNRLIHVNDTSDPQNVLTTTYAYDPRGLKSSETDAEGHASTFEYDIHGQRTKVKLPVGITTSFGYDEAGRLHTITDAKNQVTTYDFDENGRPTSVTWNDGRQMTRGGYDGEDNPTNISDPDGTRIIQTFDDNDRLVRKDFQKGAGVEGPDHEAFVLDDLGRVVSAENGVSTTTFTYDSLDRTISETLATPDGSFPIWHDYDPAGNPTGLTYPSGRRVTYDIDPLNRIAAVKEAGLPIATYAFAGSRVSRKSLANNVVSAFSYDANRRVTEIVQGISGQSPVEDLTYGWTPTRRKTFAGRSSLGVANTFSYDQALRLTRENIGLPLGNLTGTPSATTGYTLDTVDNISSITDSRSGSTSIAVDDRNRITSIGSQPYSYDPAGQMTQKPSGDHFVYDSENRLLRIEHSDGSKEEFSYDALGRRIERSSTIGTTTTHTTEIETGYETVAEYRDGRLDREYVWGNGPDELLQIKRDSTGSGSLDQVLFPLQETQSSITALTDQSGAPVERYAYEAYGKTQILSPDNSPRTTSLFGNLYTWQGRPWTGSYGYFRARYFDADSRTWTAPDPLAYSTPAANLYTGFNLDGGINGTDPLGAVWNEGMDKDFKAMKLGMYQESAGPEPLTQWFDKLLDQDPSNLPTAIPLAAGWKRVYRRHIFVNGINTDRARAIRNGEEVASVFPGEAVTVVHNPTTNKITDLLQTLLNKGNVETASTMLLVRQIETDQAIAARDWWAGKNGSYVVLHAHSQGGAIAAGAVGRLTQAERRRTVLFTYGGANGWVPRNEELKLYVPYSNVGDRIPDLALGARVFQMWQGGIHLEGGRAGFRGLIPFAGPFYYEHQFGSYLESVELAKAALARMDEK